MGFTIEAADIEMFRCYFARHQPDWTVDGERQLLRVTLDEGSAGYTMRESIDLDLHLVTSAPKLERLMLLAINKALLAHVRYLMKRVQ